MTSGQFASSTSTSLPALKLVQSSLTARRLANGLVVLLVLAICAAALLPWQQSARGTGKVAAYVPQERQQTVTSPTKGVVARVGEANLPDMLALRRADQLAMAGQYFVSGGLLQLQKRLQRVLAADKALGLKDLAVNGDDLIQELGLAPGPAVGTLLQALLEAVLDDPALNRREVLLRVAHGLYEQRIRKD